jgi:hypothetical protein
VGVGVFLDCGLHRERRCGESCSRIFRSQIVFIPSALLNRQLRHIKRNRRRYYLVLLDDQPRYPTYAVRPYTCYQSLLGAGEILRPISVPRVSGLGIFPPPNSA